MYIYPHRAHTTETTFQDCDGCSLLLLLRLKLNVRTYTESPTSAAPDGTSAHPPVCARYYTSNRTRLFFSSMLHNYGTACTSYKPTYNLPTVYPIACMHSNAQRRQDIAHGDGEIRASISSGIGPVETYIASVGPFSGPVLLVPVLLLYSDEGGRIRCLVLKLHRSCQDIAPVRLFSGWVHRSRGIRFFFQPRTPAVCTYHALWRARRSSTPHASMRFLVL